MKLLMMVEGEGRKKTERHARVRLDAHGFVAFDFWVAHYGDT